MERRGDHLRQSTDVAGTPEPDVTPPIWPESSARCGRLLYQSRCEGLKPDTVGAALGGADGGPRLMLWIARDGDERIIAMHPSKAICKHDARWDGYLLCSKRA